MPDNPTARRFITIPAVVLLFVLLTVLFPILILIALAVDGVRALRQGRPAMSVRLLAFGWVYLLGQIWALLALLFTTPLPRNSKEEITYELQEAWTRWNIAALLRVFSLKLAVEGSEWARHGPMLLLSRHASMVDTMLPAAVVANPHHIRLRYVIKRELLIDPTLDVAGHRIPNHFIDRKASDSSAELEALADLASDLGSDDGVLIYPEGSRFSEEKRDTYTKRAVARGGAIAELAGGLRQTLPPRPGGTMALLEASEADVVLLAHHGLEGLRTLSDIWRGDLVGSTLQVRLWRIPYSKIPTDRRMRVEWLYRVWARIDAWVVEQSESI